MKDEARFDIAVVGAGIAGASLAARLAAHRSVVLLERESQPGYHSTGRSAAMFMESYGPPGVRALTRASRQFYLQPPDGFADVPLLAPRGALYLAQADERDLLHTLRLEIEGNCSDLRQLDRAQVLETVPCLRPERAYVGLLDPMAMDIDVNALHQGFLRTMRRHGGVLRANAEVLAAHRDQGYWQLELAGASRVQAQVVVNAAGAWADRLGGLFGARAIGLVPHRRSAFTFRPPQDIDTSAWPVASSLSESWYFKPDAGVLLGSPANADAMQPHDVLPEDIDIATAIHHIEAATTLQIRRPLRTWAGLRSFVPDGELVIGWDSHLEGFFWLAAQGGYGIQSAPGVSELAASLVLHAPMPEPMRQHGVDPATMSPLRLA